VQKPESVCNDAALTQFVIQAHAAIFPGAVVCGAPIILAAFALFRSAHDDIVLHMRSIRVTVFAFAGLLVAAIGVILGLYVLPALRCAA
jgi:hypothetical protein